MIDAKFQAKVWYWRGPSPFFFASTPDTVNAEILAVAPHFSYGWGAIPAIIIIGGTEFSTSIFPRNGEYIIPLKKAVRAAEAIDVDDSIQIQLRIESPEGLVKRR